MQLFVCEQAMALERLDAMFVKDDNRTHSSSTNYDKTEAHFTVINNVINVFR